MRDNFIYTNDHIDYLTGLVIPHEERLVTTNTEDVLQKMEHVDTCMQFYCYLQNLSKKEALDSLETLIELVHQLHGNTKLRG